MIKLKEQKPDPVVVLFLCCFAGLATAEPLDEKCAAPEIISPSSALLYESRPLIEWAKVPGGKRYRLQVRSQLPEGKVVATIDTVVSENRFAPPQPLVESRAIVTVRVAAVCAQAESEFSVKRFMLDVTRECPAPSGVKAMSKEGKVLLAWSPQGAADGYRVVLRSALNGAELERREIADAKVSFDGAKYFHTLLMASVESRCKQAVGDAVVLPINVSP